VSTLHAGFGLIEITPLVGTPLVGQIRARYASGVHDPLYARVLALRDGDVANSALLIALDVCKVSDADVKAIRAALRNRIPVPSERVWLFATHTHTGPSLTPSFETPHADEYAEWLPGVAAQAAETAWHDLAPARVNVAQPDVGDVGFIRRFQMRDGTVRTNPGVGNPDIVEQVRTPQTRLTVVEFERDATRLPIVLASFPCHADVVGGTEVSADYPGRVCNDLTHRIPSHPETLFCLGACGDINHVNVRDAERRGGWKHACRMAETLGEAALAAWDDRAETSGALDVRRTTLTVHRRTVDDKELAEAKDVLARESGREDKLPLEALWARELVLLADKPERIELEIGALIIGDLAVVCLPGEPFSALSERIVEESPFPNTVAVELFNNGGAGYLPTRDAYDNDGYEERPARSSPFAPGAGEAVADAALALLRE